jgi:hypothetical protein
VAARRDDAESDLSIPPNPADRPDAFTRHRRPSARTAALLLGGAAALGLAVGAVLGSRLPVRYDASVAVEIDQVLGFDPWEANLQTARFGQAVLRTDLQEDAMALVDLRPSDLGDISARRTTDSPIVQVRAIVDDRDRSDDALIALVDLTLKDLLERDRSPQQLLIDQLLPDLDAARAELDALWLATDEPPGTNLADAYDEARFTISSATAELAVATEQWRLDQLPGIIEAAQDDVDRLAPALDEWHDVSTRVAELEAEMQPAEARLRALELGQRVIGAGSHRSEVTVVPHPKRDEVFRRAAGSAAIAVACALALLGVRGIRGIRETAATHPGRRR